jgi:hypothetical protein
MDMQPPQAPPAPINHPPEERALAAVTTVTAMQAHLLTLRAAMPALPDTPEESGFATYASQLKQWWESAATGDAGAPSRQKALAEHLANALSATVTVQTEDGTLDDFTASLAQAAASSGPLAQGVHAFEIMLGDAPYAGALIVAHIDNILHERRVAVFTPTAGWEGFSDGDIALATLEQRWRQALAGQRELPGASRRQIKRALSETFISTRAIEGDVSTALTARAIELQRQRLEQAWFEFALERNDADRPLHLADAAHAALVIDDLFDVDALLARREMAVRERLAHERLDRVEAPVREAWLTAKENYAEIARAVALRQMNAGIADIPGLHAFTSEALRERIEALGVKTAPEDITVVVDRSRDPASRTESLAAFFTGPEPARLSLLELAYQNVASIDFLRFSALGLDGEAIPALDDRAVRSMVRELDIANRYPAWLRDAYAKGKDGNLRRELTREHAAARMAWEAADARVSYLLGPTDKTHLGLRHEETQWVSAALASPVKSTRHDVAGGPVVVSQVTYQGTAVKDILAFNIRFDDIALYTPDAPDGIPFRHFANKSEADRLFFHHPAFSDYLLDRLPVRFATVPAAGRSRAFARNETWQWVFGTGLPEGYTPTAAPFELSEVKGDFLEAQLDAELAIALDDLTLLTRSASNAQFDWLLNASPMSVGRQVLARVVEGVVLTPFQVAPALWRTEESLRAGDSGQAFIHFTAAYVSALAIAPGHTPLLRSGANGWLRTTFRTGAGTRAVRAVALPTLAVEARYVAKGVKRRGTPDRHGVYTIDGHTYVDIGGTMHHAAFDKTSNTVRLSAANPLDRSWTGPAIRLESGRWRYNVDRGLRGGAPLQPGAAGRTADIYSELAYYMEREFPDPFERDLVLTHMTAELVTGTPTRAVTQLQRIRWTRAWAEAEHSRNAIVLRGEALTARLPPEFRALEPRAMPDEVWFYAEHPFHTSELVRERIPGVTSVRYSNAGGWLLPRVHGSGVAGIRVTTVRPDAPLSELRAATGLPHLTRHRAFAVRVRTRTLNDPALAGTRPGVEFLEMAPGDGTRFVLRTTDAAPMGLAATEFEVLGRLPPAADIRTLPVSSSPSP